ncbi:MAG: phosphonate ABC transporter ATP-binding protein [Alphaproteobacteria bacterium]|nr:phosphonate ABC transporter ATP-binding protein [Alphaproteobacteria bacterium]
MAFDGIGKRFADGTQALDGVTFNVRRGAFCVLLGPSGSGKSTLLRAVNGLTSPSQGEVRIDGQPITAQSLPSVRRRVSMIHQHFGLVDRASVAENMIGGALAAIPTWRALSGLYPLPFKRKACDLLATVGLEPDHLRRPAGALSGGQRQRVGIARALMLDPEIIIADEPVASLDPKVSRDTLNLLRQAAQARGVTVLCSLHQVDLALEFADQIVALRQGRIVHDGPPAALSGSAVARFYDASLQPMESRA